MWACAWGLTEEQNLCGLVVWNKPAGRDVKATRLNNVAFFSLAAISWQTLGEASEVLSPVGLIGPPTWSLDPSVAGLGTEESCFQDVRHLALKSSQSWRVKDIGRLWGDVEGRHAEQTPGLTE